MLNGGGLAQLQTITSELGDALEGREDAVRDTLDQLDVFIGGLDDQREEINRALDSINALASTLAEGTGTLTTALDTIGPGLAVLEDQRGLLVSMLQSLAQLGDVGTRVINETGADTVANLQDLQPILSQLAAAGPDLANSLDLLLTYPFPASSLSALQYRTDQRTGGYALFTNMTADLNLDLTQLFCRYVVVDQTTGALVLLDPSQVTDACGVPGSPGGGQPAPSAARAEPGPPAPAGSPCPRCPTSPRWCPPPAATGTAGCSACPRSRPADGSRPVITRTTRLQLLAFAVVALLGMSYVGFRYVGLDRLLFGGGYQVAAEFTDSGGIFVNAEVTYRGVAVGRVSDMQLTEDGVEVELSIDDDAPPIPAGAAAAVANRSAVGEQYVDLRPDSDAGPYLATGRSSRSTGRRSRSRSSSCCRTSTAWSAPSTPTTCGSWSTSWAPRSTARAVTCRG